MPAVNSRACSCCNQSLQLLPLQLFFAEASRLSPRVSVHQVCQRLLLMLRRSTMELYFSSDQVTVLSASVAQAVHAKPTKMSG